jgi:hypothetical protein
MKVRIDFRLNDSEEPDESVDLPIPEPPEITDGFGGGHWRWVGGLPKTRVDITDEYCLPIYVAKRGSVPAKQVDAAHGPRRPVRRAINKAPRKVPADRGETPGRVPPWVCEQCSRIFPSYRSMRIHQGFHRHGPVRKAQPAGGAVGNKVLPAATPTEPSSPGPGLGPLADLIVERLGGGPHEVDRETALRIAAKVHRYFKQGNTRVPEQQIDPEDRADLHLMDGKLMGHEVLGRGRARTHWWVLRLPGEEE